MGQYKISIANSPNQEEIFSAKTQFILIRKGRRYGLTKGKANNFIKRALNRSLTSALWVDTVNTNINKYVERYFIPKLKMLPQSLWKWRQQDKILTIADAFIDFRSAEHPENIEGFAYGEVFLNEAGIILKDETLWYNTIIPLLVDYRSPCTIGGTPKGIHTKTGEHVFHKIWNEAEKNTENFTRFKRTTYDNHRLPLDSIELMTSIMTPQTIQQEIFGEFVDFAGDNPFANCFKDGKHVSSRAIFNSRLPIVISFDFNLTPFAVGFMHIWEDGNGLHHHQFDEDKSTSIPDMIDLIKMKYGNYLHYCKVTGDAMGKRGELNQRDNSSYYIQLMAGLGLREGQMFLPSNPTHENSRADCNYSLYHCEDLIINPSCKETIRDLRNVQVNNFGEIIKINRNDPKQRADYLDGSFRYPCNTFHLEWQEKHKKGFYKKNIIFAPPKFSHLDAAKILAQQ